MSQEAGNGATRAQEEMVARGPSGTAHESRQGPELGPLLPRRIVCLTEETILAKDRIVADPLEVPRRAPDIIIGSWCGRKFRPERVASRPGWESVPAVKNGELHEVKSAEILQPGPAALTDGLERIATIVRRWAEGEASG